MELLMTTPPQKLYRRCADCGGDFYITDRDQAYFMKRGLELPKRCWACRQRNKQEREAAIAAQEAQEGQATDSPKGWAEVWKEPAPPPPAPPPPPSRKPARSPVRPAERKGRRS